MKNKHNYMKQIISIGKKTAGKPGIHIVSVAHDDWCNFLLNPLKNDNTDCNCNPEVTKGVKE